jgi:hypothetical protein
MSAGLSITFTSIRTERLFAHIGSNTRLLTASKASEAIQTQRTMAHSLGLSSNQWTAGGSETSDESSDFTALPATHDMHDTHDVSLTDKIDKAETIRFCSRFKTSTTAGFQPTELRTTEYITNRMKIIDHGPGVVSDQAINWIRSTEDVHLGSLMLTNPRALNKPRKSRRFATSTRAWPLKSRTWRPLSPSETAQARN